MKNTRKGLGKGMGTGYKNLAPMDSHIHSLSAKGVKTVTVDFTSSTNVKQAGKQRTNLLNKGYKEIKTERVGFDKFIMTFNAKKQGVNLKDLAKRDMIGVNKQIVEMFNSGMSVQELTEVFDMSIDEIENVLLAFNPNTKLRAKGNVVILKGVNGWRIEDWNGNILFDKVFNNQVEAFTYYKENKYTLEKSDKCPNCGGTHEDTIGVCPLAMERTPDSEGERDERDDGSWLDAKGKKIWKLTPDDYDTMELNTQGLEKEKKWMVSKGLGKGFVNAMLKDGYGFDEFEKLQDKMRDKKGSLIDVNDYGKAEIVDKKTKGSVPVYLVVEEDFSVRYYVNPDDRSDTIMKQVFVKYKGER